MDLYRIVVSSEYSGDFYVYLDDEKAVPWLMRQRKVLLEEGDDDALIELWWIDRKRRDEHMIGQVRRTGRMSYT